MRKQKVYKNRKPAKAKFFYAKSDMRIHTEFLLKLKTRLLRCINCRLRVELPCVGATVKVECECGHTWQLWSPEA